jgi:hypothetical protein
LTLIVVAWLHLVTSQSEEALQASGEAANKLRSDAAGSAAGTVQAVDRYEVALDEQF